MKCDHTKKDREEPASGIWWCKRCGALGKKDGLGIKWTTHRPGKQFPWSKEPK